ncbi:MAG TPA: hypothetical protein VGU68_17245 [Ktedonobacteraceae bacterium]|nr:hypothetical protein [Ktedonobacteraceae bacterium]
MTNMTNHSAGNYAAVNGISLYYEIHGTGKPLIMLHGGFGGSVAKKLEGGNGVRLSFSRRLLCR